MTVGELKKVLATLDDALPIIVVTPCADEPDADELDTWFQLRDVSRKLDADIAELYARFDCIPLNE